MATIGRKLNLEFIIDLFKTVQTTTAAIIDSTPFVSRTSKFKEKGDAGSSVMSKLDSLLTSLRTMKLNSVTKAKMLVI